MRIFLAGATGVIGVRLVALLSEAGHQVTGMTRTAEKADMLHSLGARPVLCDVYDLDGLTKAVADSHSELILHELTALPDNLADIPRFAAANRRIRREGTRNLLAAAAASGVRRFVAQSVAWRLGGDSDAAIEEHEKAVLSAGGVVIRYGQFYGPDTYHPSTAPPPPRIHIDQAGRRTLPALDAPAGIVTVVDA